RGQRLMRADRLRRQPPRPLAYPGAHRGEKRPRGPSGEGDEQVAPELDVVRTDDPPALVDPDHGGNVDDVEEIGGDVLGVDQRRGPWRGPPHERSRLIEGLVERGRDRRATPAARLPP